MITAKMIMESCNNIRESWGEIGDAIIEACARQTPFNGKSGEFLDHCFACGGDWCGMLLSGIYELYPDIFDLIPNNMADDGNRAFIRLCHVLILLGVDTSES